MTSSIAARYSALVAATLLPTAIASVPYAIASARAASRCMASRAGSAPMLSSMTAPLVVARFEPVPAGSGGQHGSNQLFHLPGGKSADMAHALHCSVLGIDVGDR